MRTLLKIAVIDGQGGGIGSVVIKRIKETYGEQVEIWGLGTNAIAASQMLKAGANRGAAGENAICYCTQHADIIIGSISILVANAMMGELSPAIAQAVSSSRAMKLLLPISQEAVLIVGSVREPLPHMVEQLVVDYLKPLVSGRESSVVR